MNPEIADIIQAVVYSAGAVGVVHTIARNWYLKRKSDNETFVERTKAKQELLSDPNYKEYLQKRTDLTLEIMSDKEIENGNYINARVNNTLGNLNKRFMRI